ncbi:hypothetical protein TUMEXPCC7403_10230 [Tumidithrix helvetica PCC 7403]|uniref:hypothetical protein n=1 Tax=Tumidithrix helvetica TaxID=3457545 RepID=UPI003CA82E8A
MTIRTSTDLLRQIQDYLRSQADKGDRQAQQLLIQVLTFLLDDNSSPNQAEASPRAESEIKISLDFDRKLFDTWQELANEQVGDNFWSYPIAFEELAEAMGITVERFVQLVTPLQIGNLQLIQGRSHNYTVGEQMAASLTFHPKQSKEAKSDRVAADVKTTAKSQTKEKATFRVGDRVQVNANRPQYANQVGTVDQVISVSCRVKLDNGWSAFLPNHCLDKLPN